MYATVQDLRDEGVTIETVMERRAVAALQEATETIDRACGWFFEPREMGFALSGHGSPVLQLPVPPIRLAHIRISGVNHAPEDFVMVGSPIAMAGFHIPKLVFREGQFRRGVDNVWLRGTWGYTTPCAEHSEGETPRPIRRATMMLAQKLLPKLTDDESIEARQHWRLLEERTRDQSYRMEAMPEGTLTGDPEVDAILLHYRRPLGVGAA